MSRPFVVIMTAQGGGQSVRDYPSEQSARAHYEDAALTMYWRKVELVNRTTFEVLASRG